jgi:hypothetical protein
MIQEVDLAGEQVNKLYIVSSSMGSTNSKVECIIKPGQSGKTRTMQEKIRIYQRLCPEGALNIVICSNNKKLVEATTSRMANELFEAGSSVSSESDSDDKIEGSCFTWTSGSKKSNISAEHLALKILAGEVTMVVCCSHKTRFKYLYSLIDILEKLQFFTAKINVWIDEADASIKLWSLPQFDVTRMTKVEKVTLVSATFGSVFKVFKRIRVLPLEITHPECYHKVKDCVLITDDTRAAGANYLMEVFSKDVGIYSRPGYCLFAPGDNACASHEEIEEFLHSHGFVVMILNGRRKEITFPDGSPPVSLNDYIPDDVGDDPDKPPMEVGMVMADIYKARGLQRFPFAITGKLCLGRGLTFQGKDFIFDGGIIPPISDPAEAYQCACRVAGNIKNNDNYKCPTLITTSKCMEEILEQEAIAVNLARIVYDNGFEDIGEHELKLAIHNNIERYEEDKLDAELNDYKHPMSVVLSCSPEQLADIHSAKAKDKRIKALEILKEAHKDIYSKIVGYECKVVTRPRAEAQYKKVVTDVVKRTMQGQKCQRFKEHEKKKNIWEAILDDRENRIIFSYYHGEATCIPKP